MERQMQPMEDNDKEASTSFHVSPSLGNTANLPLLGNTTNPVYANHCLVCSNTLPTEHILQMTSSITQQRHLLGPNGINDEVLPRHPTIVYANGRHYRVVYGGPARTRRCRGHSHWGQSHSRSGKRKQTDTTQHRFLHRSTVRGPDAG